MDNLWAIKTILRCFELASSLRVNFANSCIIGINVDASFPYLTANFLHCSIGSFPFKYMALPIGANSRKLSTWQPLLDMLLTRLSSWINRFVGWGGRVILLNSVLDSIPIFFLSFLKMSNGVWRHIVRIQRRYLCVCVGGWGARKIPWVWWSYVCRLKNEGGLGIRDLRLINLALLGKWHWRRLVNLIFQSKGWLMYEEKNNNKEEREKS